MSNRAKFAAAIAAAGLLAVLNAPAAEAATVNPLTGSIDFGNVLLNTTTEQTLTFSTDPSPGQLAIPITNGQGNFVFGFVPGSAAGQCNLAGPQCTVSFKFTPLFEGLQTALATITFLFVNATGPAPTPIEATVDIRGVGVVPVPAALPLFLTGLGGLAYMSRRRNKAAAA